MMLVVQMLGTRIRIKKLGAMSKVSLQQWAKAGKAKEKAKQGKAKVKAKEERDLESHTLILEIEEYHHPLEHIPPHESKEKEEKERQGSATIAGNGGTSAEIDTIR